MLIGFAGKAGAGKDTAGAWCVHRHRLFPYALATPIKEMLNAAFGWTMRDWANREWKETSVPGLDISPRRLAQTLGTEWRDSTGDPQLWCKIADMRLGGILQRTTITDIRFVHEQNWVHDKGGIIVNIIRPDLEEVAAHLSENSLDLSQVDITINNDGSIEDLHRNLALHFPPVKDL